MRKPHKIVKQTVERVVLVIHPKDRNAYVKKYTEDGYSFDNGYPLPARRSPLSVSTTRYALVFERQK